MKIDDTMYFFDEMKEKVDDPTVAAILLLVEQLQDPIDYDQLAKAVEVGVNNALFGRNKNDHNIQSIVENYVRGA